MDKLVEGIYDICNALQPVAAALLVLSLIITGISTIVGGADGRANFKETIKWILIGSAIAFGASSLGKMIMGWFI